MIYIDSACSRKTFKPKDYGGRGFIAEKPRKNRSMKAKGTAERKNKNLSLKARRGRDMAFSPFGLSPVSFSFVFLFLAMMDRDILNGCHLLYTENNYAHLNLRAFRRAFPNVIFSFGHASNG